MHNNVLYENPFGSAENSIEPDIDLTGQSTTTPKPLATGNITHTLAPPPPPPLPQTSTYAGEDTLDEPVTTTIV